MADMVSTPFGDIPSFIFGGNTGVMSPKELEARRRALIRRYPGYLRMVAAAYNAGAEAVDQYGGVPPYAETQAYVEKALTLNIRYRDSAM